MEKFRGFGASARAGKDGIFNYRIGLATYGEHLKNGMPYALGFNGCGYDLCPDMMTGDGVFGFHTEARSFILELDGQALVTGWKLVGIDENEEGEIMTVRVSLKHTFRPVEVVICTK